MQPCRPFTYLQAADNVYVISHDCYIGCDAGIHDESCEVMRAGQIIDSKYLDDQLQRGAEISRCIGLADLEAAPYILDIDLDVFHTRRSINPENPSTFYRMIKNAVAITVVEFHAVFRASMLRSASLTSCFAEALATSSFLPRKRL